MGSWVHVHLEAFCLYESLRKKGWHLYRLNDDGTTEKSTYMKNPDCIHHSKRPMWCRKKNKERTPCYRCLESDCPFLGYIEAEEDDIMWFDWIWNQKAGAEGNEAD